MKCVAVDCRFASVPAGLGTVTRELTLSLTERSDPWNFVLIVRSQQERWLKPLKSSERIRIVECAAPHYSFAEQWELPRLLRAHHADLLFVPHFNAPFFCPVPFVATIHDLILHRYPGDAPFLKRLAYRLLMRAAVRNAKAILAPSHLTACDITSIYRGGIEKKIRVAHLGVSKEFSPKSVHEQEAVRKKCGLPQKYLLYVSGTKVHKNVPVLLEAFRKAKPQSALVLLTGGSDDLGSRLQEREILLPVVDQHDLPALYSAAHAAVTATLYEGFGLPMLEAMACGCPVLATNVGSIPEVAGGGGALLVEPTVDAVAAGIRALASMDRMALSKRGQEWAAQFTWEKTAKQVAEMFTEVLASQA